ncbi:unnamed protein product [Brassica rapa subsp. trilocularis]
MGKEERHVVTKPKSLPLNKLVIDKSCRLQWINYLRPDVKRGNFSVEEEETITELHQSIEASMWSKIASKLPGRTDKVIKNAWNTGLTIHVQVKQTQGRLYFFTSLKSNELQSKFSNNNYKKIYL